MALKVIQNFYKETLSQDWPTGTGKFYVTVKPTVTNGYLTISPASSSLREIILFTATGTDGTGDYVTISTGGRGLGGTTEQTHIIGEPIRMNVIAETIDEINDSMPIISSGTTAPSSTPTKVGDLYINTSGAKLYFAKGTSSSADWVIAN